MDDAFTYVATWKGFVYVAFVIDAYRRITALLREAGWIVNVKRVERI